MPAKNTTNPVQCVESRLLSAAKHGHGLCLKDAIHQGNEDSYLNVSPLSFLQDSSSHLLGGCRHRGILKSYIECQNQAGLLILKAITKGKPVKRFC